MSKYTPKFDLLGCHEIHGEFVSAKDAQAAIQALEQRIAKLEQELDESNKRLLDLRDKLYVRFLDYRGLAVDEACKCCSGSGVRVYANTSAWRGGIGGQAMTTDVCDKCWGSGNKNKPWLNLRRFSNQLGR